MVTDGKRLLPESDDDHICVYASRKDGYEYAHSHEEVLERYGDKIVMCERMPEILAGAMGNQMYTAHADDEEAANEFIAFVHEKRG